MKAAASLPFLPEVHSDPGAAAKPRRKKNLAEIVLMHLRRAARLGALRKSDGENVAIAGINAFVADMKARGMEATETAVLKRVSRLLATAGHSVGEDRLRALFAKEERFGLLDVEGFGELLNLTPAERIEFKVWTIGAQGQSREDRITEREARKAERRGRYNEERRVKRAAQPKRAKLSATKPWVAAGISRRTWYRRNEEASGGTKGGAHNSDPVIDAANCATPGGAAPRPRAAQRGKLVRVKEPAPKKPAVTVTPPDLASIKAASQAVAEASRTFTARLMPVMQDIGRLAKQMNEALQPYTDRSENKAKGRAAA